MVGYSSSKLLFYAQSTSAVISGRWQGTEDAEIKVSSAENAELSKVPFVRPGVGQNAALAATKSFASLISAHSVLSSSFFPVLCQHKST